MVKSIVFSGVVYLKFFIGFLMSFSLGSCGIPDSPVIPAKPISTDGNSLSDNSLAFMAPTDDKIDRYIIWYKIYPYDISQTATQTLVTTDYEYFTDGNIRDSKDIRERDFYEIQLNTNLSAGYYFQNILGNDIVTITRQPADTANYIRVSVLGKKSYNVRRNVAFSVTDNTRKPFYGKFNLSDDTDIRKRKSSDFSNYGTLDREFAIAFMAQSAYVDSAELEVVVSPLTPLGIIYSLEGFEDN